MEKIIISQIVFNSLNILDTVHWNGLLNRSKTKYKTGDNIDDIKEHFKDGEEQNRLFILKKLLVSINTEN